MTTSAELRERHAEVWDAAVGHRFVDELGAGTVDDAVLAGYLAQDALFLDAFVALLGAAVAAADRPGPRLVLARQLGLVAGDEDDYFTRALDRLGVRAPAEPARPTAAFLALMDDARRSADYGRVLTVLLVAEWLYLDWAQRLGAAPADWLYAEWIELHRGPAFAAWVGFLREEADRVGVDEAAFARTAQLELAFFDAAYR
ncbi:TenA family protein [Actinomycetospora soli]|uniref:TenA family protein n=1 Tax=Actinomycetospora soli TaxID=2893887 RepID=UPI001E62CECB|nr:TenA family protein [Actinomycetospora soli]MCD2186382.1 TenA family protein [Actinomycetospora soli]